MKSLSVSIILFSLIFKEASTAIVNATKEPESGELSLSDSLRSKNCLDEFTPRIKSFLPEVRNESLLCVETADSDLKIKMESIKEFRAEFVEQLKGIQSKLDICTQTADASKYLDCVRSFTAESKNILHQTNVKTELFSKRIKKIENQKHECQEKTVNEVESKSNSAIMDLKQCLLYDNPTPKEQEDDDINLNLSTIRSEFDSLRSCLNSYYYDRDRSLNFELNCMSKVMIDKNLKDNIIKQSAKYFLRFSSMDKEEDKCYSHFVTTYIFPDFPLILSNCISGNFKSFSNEVSSDDKLTNGMRALESSLQVCKVLRSPIKIVDCILYSVLENNLEREFEIRVNLKSVDELKQINRNQNIFNFDDKCMEYFFRRIKFRGLSMDSAATNALEECLYKHYT